MSRHGFRSLALTSAMVALFACGSPRTTRTTLVLTGSSTIAPLVGEIAQRFEALHPTTRVDVQTGGSSRGIADTLSGIADLGMSSRSLAPDERVELDEHLIAYDGVAFIVHGSNPVAALTDDELRAIYTGGVTDWDEIGGHTGPITAVSRAASRSELALVTSYLGIEPAEIRADLVAGENQHVLKTVAGDPLAIAYMSLGAAEREVAAGAPLRLVPLRGTQASSRAIADGHYPLSRPLLLLSRGEQAGLVSDFLAFARSPDVDDLIESLAYVPPSR